MNMEEKVERSLARLQGLRTLCPGWLNGEGSSIDSDLLTEVASKIDTLVKDLPPLYIFPEENGGLLLEWVDLDTHIDVEAEFDPSGSLDLKVSLTLKDLKGFPIPLENTVILSWKNPLWYDNLKSSIIHSLQYLHTYPSYVVFK